MNDSIAIKVENVSKKYILQHPQKDKEGNETNELLALNNISFEIKKGERVGIVGSNGSGKSTLLKILAGVTKPTSGKVTMDGRVASILDIGAGFHPDLSGKENIFLNGQLLGFTKNEIAEKYIDIVVFSGIEKFIEEPVKNYSNGMYLRLAFSIMIHLDFDIYLLDEVMGVGDTEFQIKVNHYLEEQNKKKSVTYIFVSHNLTELNANCTSFCLLENGKIKNMGSKTIINNYITKSFDNFNHSLPVNSAEFDNDPVFENDFVQIEKVYASTDKDTNISWEKPLLLNCLIRFKHQATIDVAFGIEHLLGQELCYISSLHESNVSVNKTYQNEKVLISVTIAPYTIKEGKYNVTISIAINREILLFKPIKVFILQIAPPKIAIGILEASSSEMPIIQGEWNLKVV